MSFIEALKRKINGKQIRKSDAPPPAEIEKADDELGGAESDGVVDEVLSMLQTGDLAPDMASVKSHLMSSGLDDTEAEATAQVILDTFLSDSVEKSDDFDDDDEVSEDEIPPMPDEYAKSIHRQLNKVIESNKVILKANSFLIDQVERLEGKLKEVENKNESIRRSLHKAGLTPVNVKKAVTIAERKPIQKGSYKQIIDTILDGVEKGVLKTEDVSLYEQFKQISPAAKQHLITKGVTF
jgi:hypothetical protein